MTIAQDDDSEYDSRRMRRFHECALHWMHPEFENVRWCEKEAARPHFYAKTMLSQTPHFPMAHFAWPVCVSATLKSNSIAFFFFFFLWHNFTFSVAANFSVMKMLKRNEKQRLSRALKFIHSIHNSKRNQVICLVACCMRFNVCSLGLYLVVALGGRF